MLRAAHPEVYDSLLALILAPSPFLARLGRPASDPVTANAFASALALILAPTPLLARLRRPG